MAIEEWLNSMCICGRLATLNEHTGKQAITGHWALTGFSSATGTEHCHHYSQIGYD